MKARERPAWLARDGLVLPLSAPPLLLPLCSGKLCMGWGEALPDAELADDPLALPSLLPGAPEVVLLLETEADEPDFGPIVEAEVEAVFPALEAAVTEFEGLVFVPELCPA